jgi:GT2 family glycosyltransferase
MMEIQGIQASNTGAWENIMLKTENCSSEQMPKVAIVILNWNAWAVTEKALDSINCLRYPNHEVILVDNGSSCPQPVNFKDRFPNLIFVQTGVNLGYTGGNNAGIKVALKRHASYVLVLNNDVLVRDPDLLSKLVSASRNTPSAGIFAPQVVQYNRDGKKIPDRYHGRAQTFLRLLKVTNSSSNLIPHEGAHPYLMAASDQPQHLRCLDNDVLPVTYVCGCAMFITRLFLDRVGFFDERLFMYDDEYDLCLRGMDAGFQIQLVNSTSVSRLNVCSQNDMPSYRTYLFGRNRFLLAKKRNRTLHSAILLCLHLISSSKLAITLLQYGSWHQFAALIRGVRDGILCRWGMTPLLNTLLKPL